MADEASTSSSPRETGEAATSARSDTSGAGLSFQQASELNARKDLLKHEHVKYVEEHPELKSIISDFLSQVLLNKPQSIPEFAKGYFEAYLPKRGGDIVPLCLAGPSGVGKGTLVKRLFAEFGDKFGFSVSHTTRAPREGEEDGVHYHFTDVDSMQEAIERGEFIEHANVHNNIYGTSIKAVEAVRTLSKICILEIDVQGMKIVRETDLNPKCIYISPPSYEVLEERLRSRGTESPEELEHRLGNAKAEMEWLGTPENVHATVINDDLDRAYEELKRILQEWYPDVLSTETKEDQ